MSKLNSLVFGVGLALASIGFAHAQDSVAGAWKLSIGANDDPCVLTLTPNAGSNTGSIATGANCPGGLGTVATYKTVGTSLQLYTGNGDLVAQLKSKGAAYVGKRYTDDRVVALSR
jgi:hypothetical protein